MTIEIIAVEGGNRVRIEGDFTIYEVDEYKDTLRKSSRTLCAKNNNVELDLAEVNEIDTSGLQLLATLSRQAKSKGCQMKVVSVSEDAEELINLSGLMNVFNEKHEGEH